MKTAFTLAALAAFLTLPFFATAQVSYSTNFDSLASGSALAGQDGWVLGSGTASMSTVMTGTASSGANATYLSYAGTGSSWASSGRAFAAGTNATNPLLTATAKFYVTSLTGADRYFGIGFGTASTSTSGYAGIALGGNGLRGGAGGYTAFNDVTTGLLQSRTTADFLNRWVTLTMTADRSLTSNNVTFSFSGLGTAGGSAAASFTKSVTFSSTTNLSYIQIFNDWGSSSTVQGSAFVDDVSFVANVTPVPEPGTWAALGLGAVVLLRRRKRA